MAAHAYRTAVLPVFVIPAKRVGRKLQVITREQMNLNSSMNTTMTERFNVSGAMLVKLYGDPDAEAGRSHRASRVRDMGIKSAMYGRVFFVALGLVAAIGTAVIYGLGAQMVISGTITIGTLSRSPPTSGVSTDRSRASRTPGSTS